ncbi:MAG TPA: IS66 family transposase [Longimicrobium sp.]|nr:IS66 family transposase [Longimicrobium sp.]HZG44507.1 IS66 family transposase [Longimicrobium sp.]
MLTRDEILAVYDSGPDAVVALVQSLMAQIEALSERVRVLELSRSKDSHNSHRPPSSDEPTFRRRRRKSLRGRSGKKPGGQPGHPGHALAPVEKPDVICPHTPAACAGCGQDLSEVEPCATRRRQVLDLPAMALQATEHRAQSKCCPGCGHLTRGAFPPGVDEPVQYGPGVLGLGVYLQVHHLLPYARTAEVMRDLFGRSPCEGTLARALERAHQGLSPVEAALHGALRESPVVHFDETSIRAGGERRWVHSAGTTRLTLYRTHAKRGREALDAMGVLPGYAGVAVHDAYTSYLSYSARHALCNAHLLRDLVALEEETRAPWAVAMQALLRQAHAVSQQARSLGTPLEAGALRARYDTLLEEGYAAHPYRPPARPRVRGRQSTGYNLVRRLQRHADAVLAFLEDARVPFDNNLAERDLRMLKVQQKLTGGFRTGHGAEVFCRIRSYVSTLRKQHLPILDALRSVFSGTPLLPTLGG